MTLAVETPEPLSGSRDEAQVSTSIRAEVLTLGPALVVLVAFCTVAAHAEAGATAMLRAATSVALIQLPPGMLAWRAVRPRNGWLLEDATFGLAIGAAIAIPAQVLAAWTGLTWTASAGPLAVAACLLLVPQSRRRALGARWCRLPSWFGVLLLPSLIAAMVTSTELFSAPMNVGVGWSRQHPDMAYQLALSSEVAHRMPPHYPQFGALPLAYHWFADAWMAQISGSSGTELDVVVFRFVPVLLGVIFPVAVAVCGMRLTGRVESGPVVPIVAMLVGQLPLWHGPTSWTPLWPNSTSMSLAAVLLCVILVLLCVRWRGAPSFGNWVLLALLATIAGGSKGTVLPLLLCGSLATLAFARSTPRRTVLVDVLTIGASLALLMPAVFSGTEGGLRLTPFHGLLATTASLNPASGYPKGTLLIGFILICLGLVSLPWIGAALLFRRRDTRRDPMPWLLLGIGVAGVGGMSLLQTFPANQLWFRYTAQIPLSIALTWTLILVLSNGPKRTLTVLIGLLYGGVCSVVATGLVRRSKWPNISSDASALFGLLIALAVVGLILCRRSRPRLTAYFMVALIGASTMTIPHWWPSSPAGPQRPMSVSSGQIATARFIRAHAASDAMVATNRHCTRPNPIHCDARHFWYAGYTEHRMLLEGWAYTSIADDTVFDQRHPAPYTLPFWNPSLLALNDGFFRHPTLVAAHQLWARGVRWALVDRTVSGATSLSPYATLEFSTPTAQAWKLQPPS